ncbi:hypothetical protein QBC34DRAFT_425112 [Podospora aff. communis PSN243]|uniref:Uncharacterized protein n=1 Tax=Podospora aff. communis PSN243 TaxID=3040156 RepID=A0AAV9GQ82_9PEZI|nr:hypothetical protein QBC34DRAFT_425112 [Podospora aff. communis PSN243]
MSQSIGGGSSQDGVDGDHFTTNSPISPRTLSNQTTPTTHHVPPSPYLTEEAHVHSLQHPPTSPSHKDDAAGWTATRNRRISSSNISHMPLLEEASPGPSASESHAVFPHLHWKKYSMAHPRTKEMKIVPLEPRIEPEALPKPVEAVDVIASSDEQSSETKAEVPVKASVERGPSTASRTRRIRFMRGGSWHSTAGHKRSDSSATDTVVTKPKASIEEISRAALQVRPQLWATQYPGGEATRVNTPPLKEDAADGRPRGLFFDVNGPSNSDQPGSESASSAGPNAATPRPRQEARDDKDPYDQRGGSQHREWWDIPSKAAAAAAASKRNQLRKSALFEFNLPEHLPTSPMCPANSKHPSGGKVPWPEEKHPSTKRLRSQFSAADTNQCRSR